MASPGPTPSPYRVLGYGQIIVGVFLLAIFLAFLIRGMPSGGLPWFFLPLSLMMMAVGLRYLRMPGRF